MAEGLQTVESGADPMLAGCRLSVNLDALADNYRTMVRLSGKAKTAAVVKADAYGLGVEPVGKALAAAGCERFFVTWPEEGIALRRVDAKSEIFVLGGVLEEHAAAACAEANLVPVLNSPQEATVWMEYWRKRGGRRPCAIHVDTGMNRLGFPVADAAELAVAIRESHVVTPILIMSHLACADDPRHPKNLEQLGIFNRVRQGFPGVESSLANSAGVMLGAAYHFDLTRPGIALYGGAPAGMPNPMRAVVTAEALVRQIRFARAGETVSYGATLTLRRDTAIAVASIGYGDGFHRCASGSGVPLRETSVAGGHGFVAGQRVPILGRVTMDVTMFDTTDLGPDAVKPGDWIELFGSNIDIEEAAIAAGTISYEVLTDLGRRYYRRYVGGEAGSG